LLNVVIPMAGKGSRFSKAGFELPKPLISVNGKTFAEHSVKTLGVGNRFVFITRTFENPEHNEMLTEVFENLGVDFMEVRVDGEHYGAAHSAMFAEKYINPDDGLIVTNCDQYLDWDGKEFVRQAESAGADGAIALYESKSPKNSFAIISDGYVSAVAEKQPISDNALIGVHYWRHAKDFFDSARMLLSDFRDQGYPECYVSVTYNYLIKNGAKIAPYFTDGYYSLGTPDDLERFKNEF